MYNGNCDKTARIVQHFYATQIQNLQLDIAAATISTARNSSLETWKDSVYVVKQH